MKRKIEQLANGEFEYMVPKVCFSVDKVEAAVQENERYYGSFVFNSSDNKRIKGFLYSSDARVACQPREFFGLEPKISFDVDVCGMKPGDILEGAFTVCSNIGEYILPFHFELDGSRADHETGVETDLDEFAALAKENYSRACTLFYSESFREQFLSRYPSYESLYAGLQGQPRDASVLEEFLIAVKKKEPLQFKLQEKVRIFDNVERDTQEFVEISKRGWGFERLEIVSDAEFIRPMYTSVSTEHFLGSSFRLEYLIDVEKMHAGINFGRITVRGARQTLTYEIEAQKAAPEREGKRHIQRKYAECLYRDYVEFRLKRININTWITRSLETIAGYQQAGGSSAMVRLYQAQIFFAAEQPQEACAILESFEKKKAMPDIPEVKGYYQYLTTFYNKDSAYIDHVQAKVEELFLKNQENWVLQWVLLYLKESLLAHPTQKLDAIRKQYICGCRSRLMYLEAYYVYQKSPLLLKKFDAFEIQVLRFICRNDLLNKELVMQVADIAGRQKQYDDKLLEILVHCYTKYPSKSVVNAICSILIKGHKTGAKYFNWYEKGVSEGLRLAGLYEYYVESMGRGRGGVLPQMIRMYFSYDNTFLNYEKKAVIYANIVANRENDERTFEIYRPTIEKFMVDQLQAGHVNRELAEIYQAFLTKGELNRRMAEHLAQALFTCEICCESKDAAGIAVVHRQLDGVQIVSLSNGVANAQIYAQDAWIFVIDHRGNWHADTIPYTVTRLLDTEIMFNMCRKAAPESPGFLLHFCSEAQRKQEITGDLMWDFCGLLEYEDVKESYKQQLRQDILDYFYNNPKDEQLYGVLQQMDLNTFMFVDRKKTIELLVSEGMCREAFELIGRYGPEDIDSGALVRLCSRSILERDKEKDDMLMYLCHYCFEQGKYDETMLEYLLSGYDGPVVSMKRLWQAGCVFGLDTFLLEEKILIMILFTGNGFEDTEEIFDAYRKKLGKKLLLDSYLNLMSMEYFVKGHPVKEQVFEELIRRKANGENLHQIASLALLLYDSRQTLDEARINRIKDALQECKRQHMYFAFFEKLPQEFLRLVQLQDGQFLEYRTVPGTRVMLHYIIENQDGRKVQERTEVMKESYAGIYVKYFTLFHGEKMTCRMTAERDGKLERLEEQIFTQKEDKNSRSKSESCYDMLNEMSRSLSEKREGHMKELANVYLERKKMVEKIFTLS